MKLIEYTLQLRQDDGHFLFGSNGGALTGNRTTSNGDAEMLAFDSGPYFISNFFS